MAANVAEKCPGHPRHHARKLWLFGSVLRDDFGRGSDIDVLVEFEPGHAVRFGIIDVEEELSRSLLLGHLFLRATP